LRHASGPRSDAFCLDEKEGAEGGTGRYNPTGAVQQVRPTECLLRVKNGGMAIAAFMAAAPSTADIDRVQC
jgi:hypothetical protein